MNITTIALALALLAVPLAGTAAAEEPVHNAGGDEPTVYKFDDDLVRGDGVGGDGEILRIRKRGAKESLIRARTHWIPELLKTAEAL